MRRGEVLQLVGFILVVIVNCSSSSSSSSSSNNGVSVTRTWLPVRTASSFAFFNIPLFRLLQQKVGCEEQNMIEI
jgi:hypothetical protein